MPAIRSLHPDFKTLLQRKDAPLVTLFTELRAFLLRLHPSATELLYHTHALSAVFSVSPKLGDAYCMIPIYTKHLNLGFNKGTLLDDPHGLLTGSGTLIRHIPIVTTADFDNPRVAALVKAARAFAEADADGPVAVKGETISKIKK
jgi:hypothetical protein